MTRQVRVLIIDDSAFMRKILSDILSSDPAISVVGTARDGRDGVEKIKEWQPDVATLDIEMPNLDGYGALREIMAQRPTPVIMVSSHTQEGAEATVRCLALGAVDFVAKPSGSISLDMHVAAEELVAKVKAGAHATPRPRRILAELPPLVRERKQVAASIAGSPFVPTPLPIAHRVVVIGCSTGGPGALHQIMPRLPGNLGAGLLIVQHMPAGFTRSLAQRLDDISAIHVKEAEEGDRVVAGQALIAPGGYHMEIDRVGRIKLNQEPPLHGVRPAVDKTLDSAIHFWGSRMTGVILTGMGFDGARGIAHLKKAGGRTIAEDASTCVVYGMPKVVVEMGVADQVLPVHEIADAIVRQVREG